MRTWRRERPTQRLEVNHLEPARGAHRSLSCLHHLENLETLCVACHAVETSNLRATDRSIQKSAAIGAGTKDLKSVQSSGEPGVERRRRGARA
jgi:hypothetical protein